MADVRIVPLYPAPESPTKDTVSASLVSGIPGDTRRIPLYPPSEIPLNASISAAPFTGIPGDTRRIPLGAPSEVLSDVLPTNTLLGTVVSGGGGLPTLAPTTAVFTAGATSGSLIAAITGLSSGETIASVFPNDGRVAISSGSALVVGLTASAAGTISYTITTSTGRTLTIAVTANAAAAGGLSPTVATLIIGQAAGVPITSILGVPAGVTPTFTPTNSADAGKVAVAGSGAMARLVTGSVAAGVGSIPGTLAATGVASTSITISAVALPTAVLLESFDTFDNTATGGTTYGTGAVVTLDTADKVQGTASIDVKADSAVTTAGIGYDRTPTTPNIDPTAIGVVALRMKVVDETQLSQASGQLFRGGNAGSLSFNEVFKYPSGWQWQAKDTSGFPSAFLTSGSGPVRRRFGTAGSGPSREIKFDGAYYGAKAITGVVQAFEDGYRSQLDTGAPLCQARGLPFDMHIEDANLTGGGTAGAANQRLTVAQVTAMIQQYGMHVYSQGDGLDVRSAAGNYANPAAVVAMYDRIKASIISRGWGDARTTKHISYPSIGGNAMDQAIVDALVAAGYLSGRGGQGQPHFTRFGPDCKIMNRPSTGMAFNTTAATMLAGLDAAIAIGADWHFHIHDISDNGSAIGPKTSEYTLLLDGIAQRRDAGLCRPMHLADIMDIVYAGSAPA